MSSTVSPCAQSRGRRRILGFLTAALLVFGLGSASFADGGAPTLRVTLTPNARTVKTGDNVVYTVEFSCASTDANCDGAVLTVDVPRFSSPDGAVNSEAAPILAAASTTGVVAPPTIVAPPRGTPTERSSISWERRPPAPRARRRSRSGRRAGSCPRERRSPPKRPSPQNPRRRRARRRPRRSRGQPTCRYSNPGPSSRPSREPGRLHSSRLLRRRPFSPSPFQRSATD